MARQYYIVILCSMFLLFLSCPAQEDNEKLQVAVSILPQKYFVERIANKHIKVNVIVQPGKSPASFAPTPQQILELANSRVYFSIGVAFEELFIPRIEQTLTTLSIVDTSRGTELRDFESFVNSDHGDHGKDPHIWLDPLNVKAQASIICDTLIEIDPVHAAEYLQNYNAFVSDLDHVHQQLLDILAPIEGKSFFVHHPAYGYFADAYGLKQVAISAWSRGTGSAYLEEIIEKAYKEDVKVIFVQPQFDSKSALAVAEVIGAIVVPLDPLALDYLDNLLRMGNSIAGALKDQ